MSYSEETIQSADGTSLYVQHWKPEDKETAKARVVFVHGYLEHGGRYEEVSKYFASKGILGTAFDYRGHGKSSGQRGYIWSFHQYHSDLEAVLNTCADDCYNKLPTFVLAHSNGGLIALDYLMQENNNRPNNIKGIIISSPWLAPADELPRSKILASKVLGNCAPRLSLPATEVTPEQLTHDQEKIKQHKADDLVLRNFTVGWALESMKAQARVRQCREIQLPIYFVYAGADTVASSAANKEFAEAIVQVDKTVVEKQEAYHEVLNETDRQELFEAIAKWILERST